MSEKRVIIDLGAEIGDFSMAMKRVQKQMKDTVSVIDREMSQSSKGVKKHTASITDSFSDMGNKIRNIMDLVGYSIKGGLLSTLPAAVPMIAAIGGAAGGLASTLAAAGAGFVGFGAVATSVLGDVFEATDETFGNLTEEQQKAYKALQGFKSFWKDFANGFDSGVVDIFTKSLDSLRKIIESSKPAIEGTMNAVSGLLDSLDASLESTDMQRFFDWMGTSAGPAVEALGKIFGNTFRGIANLMVAFQPLAEDMQNGLVNMTEGFVAWSSALSESKGFQTFVEYVKKNGPVALSLFKNIMNVIGDLIVALAPLGEVVLSSLDKAFGGLAQLTEKIKDASISASNYASDVKAAFKQGDWAAIGTIIGTGLGSAVDKIAGFGQKLGNKIATEINAINWGTVVANAKTGITNFISAFLGMLDTDLQAAFNAKDWGAIGTILGEKIVAAIEKVKEVAGQIATKVSELFVAVFNGIDWVTLAQNVATSVKTFAIALAGIFGKDFQTALKAEDWTGAGAILGEKLREAIMKLFEKTGEFAKKVGEFFVSVWAAVDWATLGKEAFVGAVGFIAGFVAALLNPMAWLEAIKQYWKPLLMIIVSFIFMPAKWLGLIGKALAKIPIVGKLAKWLWDAFVKLIEPLSKAIDFLFKWFGKGFLQGWKAVFGDSQLVKIAMNVVNIIKGFISKVKMFFSNSVWDLVVIFQKFGKGVGTIIAKVFKYFVDIVQYTFQFVWGIFRMLLNVVIGIFKTLWSVFRKPFQLLGQLAKAIIDKVRGFISGLFSKASGIMDKLTDKLGEPWKSMWTQAKSMIGKVKSLVDGMWSKVSSIAGKIKSKVGGMFKGIKTPHFSISGSMNPLKWASQGMPKIKTSWYASGGIFTGASVIGVGEAGDEAVVPLSNKSRMKPFASAIASMLGESGSSDNRSYHSPREININVAELHVREEADVKKIADEIKKIENNMDRAGGLVSYGY